MKPAPESDAEIIAECERLALAAGRVVAQIFEEGCAVDQKADLSPVTAADHAAEKIIIDGLRRAFPAVPCVAEEEIAGGHVPPELGDVFFLIDPLDGTREFIARKPDFTVNIALVRDGVPSIGVVFAPARGKLWSGRPGHAEEVEVSAAFEASNRRTIMVRPIAHPPTVVASRSHRTPETDAFIAETGECNLVSVGSSLKFCLVASGEADIYPRFGRTMEWDTAAGDAVLRAAGGMTRTLDGAPLAYGKRQQAHDSDFANPYFVASGAA